MMMKKTAGNFSLTLRGWLSVLALQATHVHILFGKKIPLPLLADAIVQDS
jgi:hypothetical protein